MIGRFERYIADPERNHAACVAVHYAVLTRIALQDALVDEALIECSFCCAGISSGDGGGVVDVVFREVLGVGDEGGWGFAGHEKCAGVEGVADGDVAEAVEDGVVVEDVVGCDEG